MGTDTLSPRLEILAVAYAIVAEKAATAEYSSRSEVANYATISGTASMAATVSDNSISTTKIQSNAVTSSKLASDIAINTSGNITTTGRVGANAIQTNRFSTGGTGTGYCVGTDTIPNGTSEKVVNNTSVTDSSIILLTVGVTTNTDLTGRGLKIKSRSAGSFSVGTISGGNVDNDLPFSYLIIN